MANPLKALNEHFLYNHKVAQTLQQLLHPSDRRMISIWFDKLLDMDETVDQIIIRSDYMWFILMMLQSREIRDPFTKIPPIKLVPLKKFVPLHTYEDVLIANEPNMAFRKTNQDSFLNGIIFTRSTKSFSVTSSTTDI